MVIPSEARDLHCAANSRSFASLRMTKSDELRVEERRLSFAAGYQAGANELYDFWRHVVWRLDREHWAVDDGLQRDAFPGWAFGIVGGVQQHGVGAVEKSLCGSFKVGSRRVEDGQIEIRFHEAQDAV